MPKDRNRHLHVGRDVVHRNTVLGHVLFFGIPKGLFPGDRNTDTWFSPYWDSDARSLRFRLRDGRDLMCDFGLPSLGNKGTRALGSLALAEGLLDSLPGKIRRCPFVMRDELRRCLARPIRQRQNPSSQGDVEITPRF